jgi:class 3 adenylate cyclase
VGVFCEANQPTEHAKEVVQFGLDSLASAHEFIIELNEQLQIRVGVNTGGPIVTGVLGGGAAKPTFEIFGPSINMAQQTRHNWLCLRRCTSHDSCTNSSTETSSS